MLTYDLIYVQAIEDTHRLKKMRKEHDSNQEYNNRGLLDDVEPSSDANSHSNDVVGNVISPGISHRIS